MFVDLLVCLVWIGFEGCLYCLSFSLIAAMCFICLLLLLVYDCFPILAVRLLCLSTSERRF